MDDTMAPSRFITQPDDIAFDDETDEAAEPVIEVDHNADLDSMSIDELAGYLYDQGLAETAQDASEQALSIYAEYHAVTVVDERGNVRTVLIEPLDEDEPTWADVPPIYTDGALVEEPDEPLSDEDEPVSLSYRDKLRLLTERDEEAIHKKAWDTRGRGRHEPSTKPKPDLHSAAEQARRANPTMTPAEASSTHFLAALAKVKADAEDPDASDFERNNPVIVARAAYEAQRQFDELDAGGSEHFYKDPHTGEYIPERAAEHEAIIAAYLWKFGPPQDHPRAIVTGGLPGAGKSAGLKSVPDVDQFIQINSDDIKEMLSDYAGTNAGWLHEESDYLVRIITAKAVAARQNIIVDVTMKSPGAVDLPTFDDGLGAKIKALKEEGYHVTGQFTDVGVKIATERAMQRYLREGRFVPPAYIRLARSKQGSPYATNNRQTFEKLKPIMDKWIHLDNGVQNQPARVVATS